ncbi:MAG: tetratricopeptide repeat protein [Magnetococcales bacterium]|nr:tetratricopeptide repeat protein [Magnetococcales bacterium]
MSSVVASMRQFRAVVLDRIGLVLPAHEDPLIEQLLQERPRQLRLTVEDYLKLLQGYHAAAEEEWRQLVFDLTTGESYFFRDTGQMTLLQEVLLPELLQRRRQEKTLRIWSAGCSTGEEPYSIAILLDQLLPDASDWRIVLMGSDINDRALDRARQGRYGSWSFRRIERSVMEHYFTADATDGRGGHHWRLVERIRRMVTFRRVNLVHDLFPSDLNDLRAMDMIICRNVFIYFTSETIRNLVGKFVRTLSPGGFLMTGHAEMHNIARPAELSLRLFSASAVYQRLEQQVTASPPVVLTQHQPSSSISSAIPTSRRSGSRRRQDGSSNPVEAGRQNQPPAAVELQQLFIQGLYQELIRLLEQSSPTKDGERQYWLARAYANSGNLKQAEQECRQAMTLEPLSARHHTLLAHIFHEQGQRSQTVDALKKALYLDSSYLSAYLTLAMIHRSEGNIQQSRRLYGTALELIVALPDGARVEYHEEWQVRELQRQVEQLLAEST